MMTAEEKRLIGNLAFEIGFDGPPPRANPTAAHEKARGI